MAFAVANKTLSSKVASGNRASKSVRCPAAVRVGICHVQLPHRPVVGHSLSLNSYICVGSANACPPLALLRRAHAVPWLCVLQLHLSRSTGRLVSMAQVSMHFLIVSACKLSRSAQIGQLQNKHAFLPCTMQWTRVTVPTSHS